MEDSIKQLGRGRDEARFRTCFGGGGVHWGGLVYLAVGGGTMTAARLKLLALDLMFVLAVAVWLPQFWLAERIVWRRRKRRPNIQPRGSD